MSSQTFLSFYLRSITIRVFNAAVRSIGQPRFIRFMLNTETMQMVMLPAYKKDFQSFRVPKGLYSSHVGNQAMMVHSQKFCHILAEQLGWNENHSYRVPGTVFEDQQIARFDLSRANMIQQTNSVPKDPIPQSNTKQSEINNA